MNCLDLTPKGSPIWSQLMVPLLSPPTTPSVSYFLPTSRFGCIHFCFFSSGLFFLVILPSRIFFSFPVKSSEHPPKATSGAPGCLWRKQHLIFRGLSLLNPNSTLLGSLLADKSVSDICDNQFCVYLFLLLRWEALRKWDPFIAFIPPKHKCSWSRTKHLSVWMGSPLVLSNGFSLKPGSMDSLAHLKPQSYRPQAWVKVKLAYVWCVPQDVPFIHVMQLFPSLVTDSNLRCNLDILLSL